MPMKLPQMLPPPDDEVTWMPVPKENPVIASPMIVTFGAATLRPYVSLMKKPLISMRITALLCCGSVFDAAPGWDQPSIAMPLHVSAGKGDVGLIVWTPLPGMLNVMVCAEQFALT